MVELLPAMMSSASSLAQSSSNIATKKHGRKTELPSDFVPGKYAVLCGRGSKCTKSPGNQRLKQMVNNYLKPYAEAKNKVEKTSIVSTIIASVKQASPVGAFVKYEDGAWWEVEDAFAREKIGCLFRDCLHTQYRSSTKAKLARKKASGDPLSISDHSITMNSNNSGIHNSLHSSMGSFAAMGGSSHHGMGSTSLNLPSGQDDMIFGGYQDTFMSNQIQQQQQQQNTPLPFHMGMGFTPKGEQKNDEYSALLGNYLGAQTSRPHREDFMRDCMSMPNRMVTANSDYPIQLMGDGPRPNQTTSLLRAACSIVEEPSSGMGRAGNRFDDDEFPDDISDLFEDQPEQGNSLEDSFAI